MDDRFLSLERVEQEGKTIIWRVAAAVSGVGCMAAVQGRVRALPTEETTERMAQFRTNRAQQFEVTLSQGGWLRLKRDLKGRTLVRYRLGQLNAGASLEGKLRLEEKSAKVFYRELGELLWLQ